MSRGVARHLPQYAHLIELAGGCGCNGAALVHSLGANPAPGALEPGGSFVRSFFLDMEQDDETRSTYLRSTR
jgi:hypothetical protein